MTKGKWMEGRFDKVKMDGNMDGRIDKEKMDGRKI